jgi:hypothetical protein
MLASASTQWRSPIRTIDEFLDGCLHNGNNLRARFRAQGQQVAEAFRHPLRLMKISRRAASGRRSPHPLLRMLRSEAKECLTAPPEACLTFSPLAVCSWFSIVNSLILYRLYRTQDGFAKAPSPLVSSPH